MTTRVTEGAGGVRHDPRDPHARVSSPLIKSEEDKRLLPVYFVPEERGRVYSK